MKSHPRFTLYRVALTSLLAVSGGCGKDTVAPGDPGDPDALGLAVAVRVDRSTFQRTGEFTLELIPSTRQGLSLIAEPWEISTSISAPSGLVPALLFQQLQPSDSAPFDVALLIDNSQSMLTNDPDRQRIAAAQLSWETVLSQPGGRVSLLYLGIGGLSPTPGLTATGLLQSWTTDPVALSGKLDTLQPGRGSQIYSSALEVSHWIDSTTAADRHRVLLLLTDGELNREQGAGAAAVVAAAQQARVSIGTLGLGPASDRSTKTDPNAVALLQELANSTGGLYAGAATPERLSPALLSLTASNTVGVLLARFKLEPVPPPGTQVTGTVKLEHQGLGTAQGLWSFDAP